MTEKRTSIEVVPGARRLITSLRDEGYDFVTAAADIIDNSIQAGANEIDIKMEFNGDSSWFLVSDNGKGMSSDELNEAMRFGTKREYDDDELGKFGLGLKTASISQCRRLTVASRNRDPNSDIEIRQLNLDHIKETDRWEIQSIPVSDYAHILSDPLSDHPGTVILWEKLDRMMTYDPPDGMRAQKGFLKMERDLEEHLSMVFHRFLSGELGPERTVVIRIGGEPLVPWDPFARDEKYLFKFREKTIAVPGADRPFNVHFTAYLLPTKVQFSTLYAWKRASGPSDWNFQQGFYIYREDRLIQSGGWNRMRTPDEHTKYARIALDLHTDADFTLALNIMKSSVVFPPVMKTLLKDTVDELCSLARNKYTPDKKVGENSTTQNQTNSLSSSKNASYNTSSQSFTEQERREENSEPSKVSTMQSLLETNLENNNSKGNKNFSSSSITARNKERQTLGESLEMAASVIGESVALNRIKEFLKRSDPEAAKSLGW
ncbi:MAG: ATP-binding protein [Thermoplasmatales archaeon]